MNQKITGEDVVSLYYRTILWDLANLWKDPAVESSIDVAFLVQSKIESKAPFYEKVRTFFLGDLLYISTQVGCEISFLAHA
jgi:hypothetical protein